MNVINKSFDVSILIFPTSYTPNMQLFSLVHQIGTINANEFTHTEHRDALGRKEPFRPKEGPFRPAKDPLGQKRGFLGQHNALSARDGPFKLERGLSRSRRSFRRPKKALIRPTQLDFKPTQRLPRQKESPS